MARSKYDADLRPPGRIFRRIWQFGLAGLAVFTLCLVTFIAFVFSIERREAVLVAPADGIIVLTGGADRIVDALKLLEAGKGRRLFISGVGQKATDESFKRRWPERDLLFSCCIDLDFQARNTLGNAIESRRWVREHAFKSIILVTASYHMPRALLVFRNAMPSVTFTPVIVVPEASRINRWWQDPALLRILTLEFVKYGVALARTTLLPNLNSGD